MEKDKDQAQEEGGGYTKVKDIRANSVMKWDQTSVTRKKMKRQLGGNKPLHCEED